MGCAHVESFVVVTVTCMVVWVHWRVYNIGICSIVWCSMMPQQSATVLCMVVDKLIDRSQLHIRGRSCARAKEVEMRRHRRRQAVTEYNAAIILQSVVRGLITRSVTSQELVQWRVQSTAATRLQVGVGNRISRRFSVLHDVDSIVHSSRLPTQNQL